MKKMYRFPLKQNIGEAAVPTIVKGETIVRGQLIASKGENSLGANLFSSVSGVVTEVGKEQISILAEEEQSRSYMALKADTPLELVEEAGIVGLGGAGFPSYAKLARPLEQGGTVIVNAAECEPILSHNILSIEKDPEKLLRGLEIAMQIVSAENGVVAIKEKHQKAVERLSNTINTKKNIRIVLLPDLYPMGEERAVIREVLGDLLPVDSLPIRENAVVLNAETVCRIQEAVDLKKPLIILL